MCIDIAREAMTRHAAGAAIDEIQAHVEALFRPRPGANER